MTRFSRRHAVEIPAQPQDSRSEINMPPLLQLYILSPNSVLPPAMNILPLRLLLIDMANAKDSINRNAFIGVSMFPAKHIQRFFKAKRKKHTGIDVRWSTRGTSLDRAFRGSATKLGDRGGDDGTGRHRWRVCGLRKLFYKLACLCIELYFFLLEIAETAKEFRNATDDSRGGVAQGGGLG